MDRLIGLITINSMVIVLFLVTYFINRMSNNGIFFGVRFPMEYLKEKELIDLGKSYKKLVLLIFLVVFVVVNIIGVKVSNLSDDTLEVIIGTMTIGLLLVSNGIFIPYYFKTKKLKRERGWTYKKKNIVVTDTTLRKPKKDEKYKPISSKWFLFLFIFPIVMALVTLFEYNSLPQMMDIPNSTFGIFDTNTLRGKFIIYQFPISQLFIAITMYVVNIIINNSKADLNSGSIETTVIRKKKFKRLGSIMMMVTAIQIMIMFSVMQYSILNNYDITIINYVFVIIEFLTIIIFIGAFIKMGQGGKNLKSLDEKDELYKDDDDKWILGGFYYNKNDPAWMVEKRTGIGWTINFASPKAWLATGGLIIFIIINIVVSVAIS
ncbi:MAG: DUF5808 domain-containing protein [Clostridium sp.]|uniref:DUF5808 domain-containing protein n=1 Tax=Clostridium sp. TaxID=1506 RepID=UPI00303F5A4A